MGRFGAWISVGVLVLLIAGAAAFSSLTQPVSARSQLQAAIAATFGNGNYAEIIRYPPNRTIVNEKDVSEEIQGSKVISIVDGRTFYTSASTINVPGLSRPCVTKAKFVKQVLPRTPEIGLHQELQGSVRQVGNTFIVSKGQSKRASYIVQGGRVLQVTTPANTVGDTRIPAITGNIEDIGHAPTIVIPRPDQTVPFSKIFGSCGVYTTPSPTS
jgi:hypothetical protein